VRSGDVADEAFSLELIFRHGGLDRSGLPSAGRTRERRELSGLVLRAV